MGEKGLDAYVTLNLKNVRYLSGFTGTSGAVVVLGDSAVFITDFRYATQAKEQVRHMRRLIASDSHRGVADALNEGKASRVGCEENHLTLTDMKKLRKLARGRWLAASIIEELRTIKDADEIALLEKNFRLLADVYSAAPELMRPGKKEKEIAAELEYRLRLKGGEGPAFDFIVASGARSALPHGVAGDKKIKKGEWITLDWGCLFSGYHSDNTRNFSLGRPKAKHREIFDIVLEANERGIAAVKPGVPLKDIDAAARGFIEEKGYGARFGHGTGHGVGLDIHEAPNVGRLSRATAEEGMVFTIEPGIYLPGFGGVRIEDVVVVTKTGCRQISRRLSRELVIL